MKALLRNINVPLYLAWMLVLVSLSLILFSGLYSDDFFGFYVRKELHINTFSDLLGVAHRDIYYSIGAGRFTPLICFFMEFFYWLPSTPLIFKVVILIINLLAVFSFTRFLKELGFAYWTPLALLIYCGLIQFYINFSDAFTSLHAMYPLMGLFFFAILVSFLRYLRSGKFYLFIISIVLAILLILYSEIGLLVFPVLFVVLFMDERSLRSKIAIYSPFAAILILQLIATAYVRSHTTAFYDGVQSRWYFPYVLRTFAIQLFCTFPFKSILDYDITSDPLMTLSQVWPWILAFTTVFTIFLWRSLRVVTFVRPDGSRLRIFFIGLLFLFVPPAMIMLSVKYQDRMHWGQGYLPVFIQNFGLVLLTLLFFDWLFSLFDRYGRAIAAIVYSLLFIISIGSIVNNHAMISNSNKDQYIPATLVLKSLKNGILDQCESGSVIVMQCDYIGYGLGDYGYFISDIANKHFRLISEQEFHGVAGDDTRTYYIMTHDKDSHCTVVYKMLPGNVKTEVRRMNYPTGGDFSFFQLISNPL